MTNIRASAKKAASTGITLILEPLNSRDMPNYLVSRSDDIVAILKEIGEPNVKLLFDAYHVQIMEGDLIKRLEKHRDFIGHVQIAARAVARRARRRRSQFLRDLRRARRHRL